MAGQRQTVQAGKRILQVSNLDKILYPESSVSKAEVIHYYLSMAPWILRYVKYRPLSLIRYPDGITGETFFQKDLPKWRPDWLTTWRTGKERKKNYITVTEEATLAWLANLACLELHQMHYQSEHPGQPDYIVFDLDPPPDYAFDQLKELCIILKDHLEQFGYRAYLKTSGNKGLHIFLPVIPESDSDQCFDAARDMAETFVKQNKDATLILGKEKRKGRVLIDVYRNRESQTIVCPFSLRGLPHAPVSMPIHWEHLDSLEASGQYTIHDAAGYLEEYGDPWEGMEAYAIELHTTNSPKNTSKNPAGDKHKSPEQLEAYARKRDFNRTREPAPGASGRSGNAFVIHRHDASHLHYDLRLEQDGVLKSWAVPKGMPAMPGEKRLAVATEDHPLEYLYFEGDIPKGEYGGGSMLIAASGKYMVTKKKKEGFYFRLAGKTVAGEYRIHEVKPGEWLLERVDAPVPDWLNSFIPPMLAERINRVPVGEKYGFELKWDGIRAILTLHEGTVRIHSRNGNDITGQFPELVNAALFRGRNGVYDGEIVCLDAEGRPDFKKVIKRLQTTGEARIASRRKSDPAFLYLFDVLYADGIPLVGHPLHKRREILESSLQDRTSFLRISEMLPEGEALFEATRSLDLEGIMCKDLTAAYSPGKRTSAWQKVKVTRQAEVEVIGYSPGKNSLEKTLGALYLVEHSNGDPVYRGKVGTGFSDRDRKRIMMKIRRTGLTQAPELPVPAEIPGDAKWLKSSFKAIVEYASVNPGGVFREPVFVKIVK